jgi:hypothetical protein
MLGNKERRVLNLGLQKFPRRPSLSSIPTGGKNVVAPRTPIKSDTMSYLADHVSLDDRLFLRMDRHPLPFHEFTSLILFDFVEEISRRCPI